MCWLDRMWILCIIMYVLYLVCWLQNDFVEPYKKIGVTWGSLFLKRVPWPKKVKKHWSSRLKTAISHPMTAWAHATPLGSVITLCTELHRSSFVHKRWFKSIDQACKANVMTSTQRSLRIETYQCLMYVTAGCVIIRIEKDLYL